MKNKFNGEKLRDMRLLAGKTLEEVSTAAGFDTSSLSLWENGRRPSPKKMRKLAQYFKVEISAFFLLACFMTAASPAMAMVNSFDAIRVIVGEAADQPFVGMVCVGEVIQHRDSLKGFYGADARHIKKERPALWAKATLAWIVSWFTNFSKGATLFENIYQFGFPASWDRMKVVEVAQYGDHWFFVEE